MAQSPQITEVERLIGRIDRSRSEVDNHARSLREKCDIPRRLKSSLIANPLAWFGGSAGVGLLASWALRRRPKLKQKRRTWPRLLLSTLFTLAKPTLQRVITSELQRRLTSPEKSIPPREQT